MVKLNLKYKIIIYLSTLVIIGTLGFNILGGKDWSLIDSLYMTIITLSTVGYGEVQPLSDMGKIWAVILIIFGVSGFAVIISQFGAELIEFKRYRRRRMKNKIKHMKDHYIICGFGRMGAVIAAELDAKKIPFVIVDNNDEKILKMDEYGFLYINGDATLEETLVDAQAGQAKGIVVVLGTDQDNLFVTLTVRTMNHDAFVLSRCAKSDTNKKLIRAGADKVVNPYVAGGHKMAELLITPEITDSIEVKTPRSDLDLALEEYSLKDFDKYNNVMIRNSGLREEFRLLIVGVIEKDGKIQLSPGPEFVLNNEHMIMLIGEKEDLSAFKSTILTNT